MAWHRAAVRLARCWQAVRQRDALAGDLASAEDLWPSRSLADAEIGAEPVSFGDLGVALQPRIGSEFHDNAQQRPGLTGRAHHVSGLHARPHTIGQRASTRSLRRAQGENRESMKSMH